MNRKGFLKTLVMGLVGAPLAIKAKTKRDDEVSFVHIGTMYAAGLGPGDITIIDNETGKPLRLEGDRPWHTDDGKPVQMYSTQYVDVDSGLIGGTVSTYANWRPGHGLGDEISCRSFYQFRDISIKVDRTRLGRLGSWAREHTKGCKRPFLT